MFFCNVGERGHVLVHKGAEAQPEVAGELSHLMGQLGAQVTDGFQIILHREGEVHQVVQIHRVVLHLPHLQLKPRLAPWMSKHVRETFGNNLCRSALRCFPGNKQHLPGRRLRAIFWGMIWMTSYWDTPLELRGTFRRTEILLPGLSTKRGSQPLFCKFCMKSHRDVRVFLWPKSWRTKNSDISGIVSVEWRLSSLWLLRRQKWLDETW